MANEASELDLASDTVLRISIYNDVVKMCKETFHHLGFETSHRAMMIIAELVYHKLSMYRLDLKAFARHAGRKTIKIKDVELLVRRNPTLKSHLDSKYPDLNSASTSKDTALSIVIIDDDED